MAKKKPVAKKGAPPPKKPKQSKTPAREPATPRTGVAERERLAAIQRERNKKTREVGPLPEVADPARKERGRVSLLAFAKEYFPRRFKLAFAGPHKTAIDQMERCTDRGGKFACAMPRKTGKTTLAEVAVVRAVLYGFRRFVVLVCATNRLSKARLKSITRELEANDLLLADFPEVCHLIRAMERIHNRARGQTLNGKPTLIETTADGIVLPTVPGAPSSGAVVQVASMEGAIRGLNVSGPDGEQLRPDMVVLDDVQTRESAKSPVLTTDRERLVLDDVLYLAGPDVKIAAVMLCTVIYTNDLSDRFLDPERHPEWQGVRTRLMELMPDDLGLWDEYHEIRRESFRSGDEGRRGTEFLRANWEAMHKGAVISWPERMEPDELSAVQSAMNIFLENPRGFAAEFQNAPEPEGGVAGAKELVPNEIAARLSGLPRFEVPREATHLVAFIDPGGGQGRGIWYAVAAIDKTFGGSVVDYGCWPRQARTVFGGFDLRPDLVQHYPNHSLTQAVYAGLTDLAADVLGRTYYREGTGEPFRIERGLIDSGWESTTVHQWCREGGFGHVLHPSKGFARTRTSRGVSEWGERQGEKSGWHWRLTMSPTGKGRMLQFDTDAWKSFLWERLTCKLGDATKGGLKLYGRTAATHEMIAEHLASEFSKPEKTRGVEFDKWYPRPDRPDNHWLDCVSGCLVAASVAGLTWSPSPASVAQQNRARPKLADLVAAKRAGAAERPKPAPGPTVTAQPVAAPPTVSTGKRTLADIVTEKRSRRKW